MLGNMKENIKDNKLTPNKCKKILFRKIKLLDPSFFCEFEH